VPIGDSTPGERVLCPGSAADFDAGDVGVANSLAKDRQQPKAKGQPIALIANRERPEHQTEKKKVAASTKSTLTIAASPRASQASDSVTREMANRKLWRRSCWVWL